MSALEGWAPHDEVRPVSVDDRAPRWLRRFDATDRVYVVMRVLALGAGIAYALLEPVPAEMQTALLGVFGFFTAYGVLLYGAAWPSLADGGAKSIFYGLTSVLDLAFVVALMLMTGGGSSPFYRALYLWVAMFAFYHGRAGGFVASITALIVFLALHVTDGVPMEAWALLVQGVGMLMHGPLIGFLAEQSRKRADALQVALGDLESANARLVEEQSKLVLAEKLSSIGLLAAGVAHEINNPLSGVMGCLKALREKSLTAERRQEYFETIREGLDRIRTTVEGLLDFSRQRPPTITELDLADVVYASLRLLAPLVRKKDLKVDVQVAPGMVSAWADRFQLMQALVNLLMNAAQAVGRGGCVGVTSVVEPARIGVRVSDDGPGIPPELVARVCDPFFTTKPEGEGTGLGLAVTLGIVKAHGGDLVIESKAGKGTMVTIWLPKQREVEDQPTLERGTTDDT